MRLAVLPPSLAAAELPLWPPLLATRGPGARSALHAHHAIHLVASLDGELRVRTGGSGRWQRAAGVLTAPDQPHALDASGAEVLLVFLDPESSAGAALGALAGGVRLLDAATAARVAGSADPLAIMQAGGVAWSAAAVTALAGSAPPPPPPVHPRVRKLVRLLRTLTPDDDTSLATLAAAVGLSPGRLMHAFTESIGLPLRPYLAWLRLQRAAAAIVTGAALGDAAAAAGFADAAHMSRTFRRMLGLPPSALRPRTR